MENKNITTTLLRQCAYLRPYYLENGKEIESIIIYDENGIILQTRCGWLESVTENNFSHYGKGARGDLLSVTISGSVRNARKIDFSKKDNFVVTGRREFSFDRGHVLYIYVSNIFSEYTDLQKYRGLEDKKYYLYGIKAKMLFPAEYNMLKMHTFPDFASIPDRLKNYDFRYGVKRDESGKAILDENGEPLEDENVLHIFEHVPCSDENEFCFYNGLYITEGK